MSNAKRDKYGEAAEKIQALYHQGVYVGETEKISAILRAAFPETPPAEDARRLREKIMELYRTPFMALDWGKMTDAEIESFAQSRVEPWREALRSVDAWFTEYNMHWRTYSVAERLDLLNRMAAIQDKARALLASSPAPDDILMSAVTGPISYPEPAPDAPK